MKDGGKLSVLQPPPLIKKDNPVTINLHLDNLTAVKVIQIDEW
jgi:hypothetical protein